MSIKPYKVSFDRINKLVSTFRKRGNKVEEITKVSPVDKASEMEHDIAEHLVSTGNLETAKAIVAQVPKVEPIKVEPQATIKRYGVVIPAPEHSNDPKVQAILDASNRDAEAREQAITEYASLSKSAKALLKDKPITSESVRNAKRFDVVHTRAQAYGEQIKLSDWNKGIDYVETRMNNIDAEENANRKQNADAAATINAMVRNNTPQLSNNSPVFIVKQNYYVLLDGEYVYVQQPDDRTPYVLARLGNESRGSETVVSSINNPNQIPADASDYRMLLEQRPTWSEVRRAYKLCLGGMVLMDFSKSQKLFG